MSAGLARESVHPAAQRRGRYLVSAEDVLPGHPDRLCDAMAEAVVQLALSVDPLAFVGVEVALHRRRMFVTGRVMAGGPAGGTSALRLDEADLVALADQVLVGAGYVGRWARSVDVDSDLIVAPLDEEDRAVRGYSADQTISVGYADPHSPGMVPVEAYAARRVRQALADARAAAPDRLGPDGKVLVTVDLGPADLGTADLGTADLGTAPARPRLTALNVAIQHAEGVGYEELVRLVTPSLQAALEDLTAWLDVPERQGPLGRQDRQGWQGWQDDVGWLGPDVLRVNGVGDFSRGGPDGDNGLSGKKLVVDHYGPRVPIGGGAVWGKDPHKADRAGYALARAVAVALAEQAGQAVTVHLGWVPGLREPDRVSAQLADGTRLSEAAVVGLLGRPLPGIAAAARLGCSSPHVGVLGESASGGANPHPHTASLPTPERAGPYSAR